MPFSSIHNKFNVAISYHNRYNFGTKKSFFTVNSMNSVSTRYIGNIDHKLFSCNPTQKEPLYFGNHILYTPHPNPCIFIWVFPGCKAPSSDSGRTAVLHMNDNNIPCQMHMKLISLSHAYFLTPSMALSHDSPANRPVHILLCVFIPPGQSSASRHG